MHGHISSAKMFSSLPLLRMTQNHPNCVARVLFPLISNVSLQNSIVEATAVEEADDAEIFVAAPCDWAADDDDDDADTVDDPLSKSSAFRLDIEMSSIVSIPVAAASDKSAPKITEELLWSFVVGVANPSALVVGASYCCLEPLPVLLLERSSRRRLSRRLE